MQRKVARAGQVFHRARGFGAAALASGHAGSAAQTSRSNIVRARTGHVLAK
jgi:hypothetical protein